MSDEERISVLEARVKDLVTSFHYLHQEIRSMREKLELTIYKVDWMNEFGSEK